jgi:Mrp family chromosome partitioning ATPase
MAVGRWNPQQCLEPYISGLRERLITHFEINSPGLKQPKLVGVTSCGEGAGVSTLAAGLAASLSKTGEGNVLLVDMCREQGGAHSYFNGQPGCGPMEELHAGYQERVAQAGDEQSNQLIKAPLNGFGHLVPNLKTSNYDYIVFDLPPVSQTSPTPRHASHMDIVLLVLEAEKTGQQMAARASTLMRDARSNVVTVLNKYRAYVPARLSQEM